MSLSASFSYGRPSVKHAIDSLLIAFNTYSCQAVTRQADQSLIFTVTDHEREATITKVIPFSSLRSKSILAAIIKDLHRDLNHSAGAINADCLADLRIRGARVARFEK